MLAIFFKVVRNSSSSDVNLRDGREEREEGEEAQEVIDLVQWCDYWNRYQLPLYSNRKISVRKGKHNPRRIDDI